ncbi:uncharacterized protein RJT21DRAFT_1286 [Scheffersomyces amazonensis]|uniref:uncharacterized protein n=1 Tax=Scheffersomyces amazonensis TaxID=1078765 RepID=UPI00315D6B61
MNQLSKWKCGRRIIHIKTRYLTTQSENNWLSFPFQIGYPYLSPELQKEKDEIHRKLFPEVDPNTNVDVDMLSISERLEYERSKIKYSYPKPERLTGFALFKSQYSTTHFDPNAIWNKLPQESQLLFDHSPNLDRLHQENIRVWQGYEVVDYLKRTSSKHDFNPYPFSGLYPWEIVKDKLRDRVHHEHKIEAFELDYYDKLIDEAFDTSTRSAESIFHTQLQAQDPHQLHKPEEITKLYNSLRSEEKQIYEDMANRHFEHLLSWSVIEFYNQARFRKFWNDFMYNTTIEKRPLLEALKEWKSMSDNERKQYNKASRERIDKEGPLDIQTAMVMDYIYYVGGVEGVQDYHWFPDMIQSTPRFLYLSKCYTETKSTW